MSNNSFDLKRSIRDKSSAASNISLMNVSKFNDDKIP